MRHLLTLVVTIGMLAPLHGSAPPPSLAKIAAFDLPGPGASASTTSRLPTTGICCRRTSAPDRRT